MEEKEDNEDPKPVQFHEMDLDERILKAVAKLGWMNPTLIQEKAIPLLLEGKDVLLRARTGSGKTAAFGIPIIQKILDKKQKSNHSPGIFALVMAPTRELCHQILVHFQQLSSKCGRDISVVDIAPQLDISAQKPVLVDLPDIVIGTPARILAHLKANTMSLKNSLEMLIIDEADLVLSFGYGENVNELVPYLPRVYQAALASATLSDNVMKLKKLLMHNTVTLKLQEPELAPITQLSHYLIYAEEEGKAAMLYTLLKLNLIRGKTIIFVNTVDKCYKLKLFLEQFAVKCCLINSELPSLIRCQAISQFNSGMYNVIIASDEHELEMTEEPQSKKRKKDSDAGVARGIDFQFVSNVINFDFPPTISSYIHRAGRTARGNNKGCTLSLISVDEKPLKEAVDEHLMVGLGCETIFKPYKLKLEDVEGFKYRARDAWRATTRIAVREARLKEIKQELLNNQKLKGYFEDNPKDLKTLRHDKALHTVKARSHLADVPDYLIPPSLKNVVDLTRTNSAKKKNRPTTSVTSKKYKARKRNPLLSSEGIDDADEYGD